MVRLSKDSEAMALGSIYFKSKYFLSTGLRAQVYVYIRVKVFLDFTNFSHDSKVNRLDIVMLMFLAMINSNIICIIIMH